MGCGGQDLRHLGSGFELGAIFTFKQNPSPLCHRAPFRGTWARAPGRRVLALDRIKTPQGSGVVSKGRWGHQRPHTCTF